MKCPNCQTENREGAEFCRECGQSLQPDIVCPQCGHASPQDSKFCDKCGQPLAEPTPTPAPSPPAPPSSDPTSFAGGRYQVKQFLGEGGMKKVYLAHDSKLDRDVAFALTKTEELDKESRTRFIREARIMGKLGSHPNVVTIHDLGEHEGQPYMILPVILGGDVEQFIRKMPEHQLSLEQTINIGKSICLGIDFIHSKGIIHRDLKPSNVYMDADGTVKVGDFGLSMMVDISRLTEPEIVAGGTALYMAPEHAMGGEVTSRTDLYSLGVMLYRMVTGRPPFVGDSPIAIIGQHINTLPVSPAWYRTDLLPSLETIILQLLEKDPQRRPTSVTDVYQALESIEAGKITKTPSEKAPSLAELKFLTGTRYYWKIRELPVE